MTTPKRVAVYVRLGTLRGLEMTTSYPEPSMILMVQARHASSDIHGLLHLPVNPARPGAFQRP
jgi:hypothetical protein